jgi:hypothetical protein
VDGEAARQGNMADSLIDPYDLAQGVCPIPRQPQLQAVGEVSTHDEIVCSLDQRHEGDDTVLACSVGPYTCIFRVHGFGSLAASPLPPCMPHGVIDLLATDAPPAAASTRPHATPFKSPLLSRLRVPGASLQQLLNQLSAEGPRALSLQYRFRTDFAPQKGYQVACQITSDGAVLVAGGSDGVVRAFLLDDPDLAYTAVRAGAAHLHTPRRGAAPPPAHVSPLQLVVGRVRGEVQALAVAPGDALVVVAPDNHKYGDASTI